MPINTHPLTQEELMGYLDGEMPVEQAVTAASHLESCAECRLLAADLRNVSRQLDQWQIDAPGPALSARVFEAFESNPQPGAIDHGSRPRREALWKQPWAWVACSAAVLIAVGMWIPRRSVRHAVAADMIVRERMTPALQGSAGLLAPSGVIGGSFKAPEPATSIPSGPLIIRNADLNLTATDFGRIQNRIEQLTQSHHGYIAELKLNSPVGQGRSLNARLRVPAAQLDVFLSELKQLGRLDSESQNGEDVTRQVVDVNARLSNLRVTEQRLNDILRQRAGRLADVLQVEEQIDRVRGEIETTEAEQKSLADQIAYAAVSLQVAEEYKAPLEGGRPSTSTRLRNAAVEGCRTLVDGLIGFLAFLLSAGPSLCILFAVLFFPVRWAWRKHHA
ncbi:MAG: DUF4349 domain-containing protein [Bryobacteraceae bacterium]